MIKKLLSHGNCLKKQNFQLFAIALLVMFGLKMEAQVSGYTFAQDNITALTALTSPTVLSSGTVTTNKVFMIDLAANGMSFTFAGHDYSKVYVSSNGYVYFDLTDLPGPFPMAYTDTSPLSSTTATYEGVISVFGKTGTSLTYPGVGNRVAYSVTGTGLDQVLRVEWNVKRIGADGGNTIFQMALYEKSHTTDPNAIEMFYATMTSGISHSATVSTQQIGLRGLDTSPENISSLSKSTNWATPFAVPGGSIGTVAAALNYITPTSYRHFTWKPPVCQAPFLSEVGTSATSAQITITEPSTLPAPSATAYYYEVRSGATVVASGNIASPAAPVVVTGLSPETTYTLHVRSGCSVFFNGPVSFTTRCTPLTPYYYEYFEPGVGWTGPVGTTLPDCTLVTQNGLGNVWKTAGATGGATGSVINGFTDEHLEYNKNASNAADTWFFNEGLNLTSGTVYRISYLYGGSHENAAIENKMNVNIGTIASAVGMSAAGGGVLLKNYPSIKASPIREVFDYTPTASAAYYLGFHAYSAADNGNLYLDEIVVEVETCFAPTALTATVAPLPGGTNTAVINFTPPATAPGSGYEYLLTTDPTPPKYDTVGTGVIAAGASSLTLNSLTPGTTYFIWIRSNCGSSQSMWSDVNAGTAGAQGLQFTTNITAPPTGINMTLNSPPAFNACSYAGGVAFHDGGGPTGNYTDNETRTYTFTAAPGFTLKLEFVSFQTENNWDGLSIYNGTTATAANIIPSGLPAGFNTTTCPANSWYGSNSPGTIFASGQSITFKWTSDFIITAAGWRCLITCVKVPVIASITPDNNNCGSPTPVTITAAAGTDFTNPGVTGVTFNGTPAASYVVVNATTITAVAPSNASTGRIGVMNSSGGTGYSAVDYKVLRPRPVTTGVAICAGAASGPTLSTSSNCSGFEIPAAVTGVSAPNQIFGNWTAASPTALRQNSTTNTTACAFAAGQTRSYEKTDFQVSQTGSYTFLMDSNSASNDGMGYITQGTFLPGTCSAGFVIADDDSGGSLRPRMIVTLTAGVTYTLYSTTWNSTIFGSYHWTVTGPVGGNLLLFQNSVMNWYKDAAGTILLGSGNTFNPVGVVNSGLADTNTPGTYTFYAACSTNATCTQPTNYVINAAPTAVISPASATICANVPVQLTVSGTATTTIWSSSVPNTLFTNAAGTIAYNGTSSLASIYVKSPVTATITVTGTYAANTCPVTTTAVLTVNSKTWNGTAWSPAGAPTISDGLIFAGNYNQAVNISGCSCTVNSGANVTIPSNFTMTIQNGVTVNSGGTLTFANNASLLQVSDTAINTGGITYTRTTTAMNAGDYTYWSTPVSPQTLVAVSPATMSDKYFTYNNTSNSYTNIASNSLMQEGKGYLIRAPQPGVVVAPYAAWTAGTPFTTLFQGSTLTNGVPNNGVYTLPINKFNSNLLNLVGNPYPSAIDADLFLDPAGVNDGKVGGTIYFWTHYTPINASGQYIASDFAVYNFVGGVGTGTAAAGSSITPNGFIASGQGFFVNALPSNPNGSVNATMNNSMRVSGQNNQFFRSASDTNDKNRIWLDLKNEAGAFKQTLVGYLNNATNDRDIYYDSDVIEAGNPVSLYSVAVTDKFAIQGRAIPFDVNDEVPLGFRAESQGAFEIVLSNFDGLFGEQDIYLEDTYLNVIHDLKQSTYSFTTTAGTFEDRFILRYTTEALGTTEATLGDNSVVVYKSQPATINISTGTTNMKKVAIYDLRGRLLIWKDNIEASQTSFPQLPFANQVLMVQVTDADGKVVTKKISF